MAGIRIRHTGDLRSCVYLVPVLAKPYTTGPIDCPTCHTLHPVKTVHLWLDDVGAVLVSEGVLAELRLAAMPDLEVVGHVDQPPPLTFGRVGPRPSGNGHPRAAIDHDNRRIRLWRPFSKKGASNG